MTLSSCNWLRTYSLPIARHLEAMHAGEEDAFSRRLWQINLLKVPDSQGSVFIRFLGNSWHRIAPLQCSYSPGPYNENNAVLSVGQSLCLLKETVARPVS